MDPFEQYPILRQLLKPLWRRHQKTLALVIAAIAAAGQARSFAIATCMKGWLGVRLDSAVNRFYRLLRSSRIDYTELACSWAQLLARRHRGHLYISIDWTEWHHELRMLTAAVVVGKRALPLFVQVTKKLVRLRSHNSYENVFLRVLCDILERAQVTATLLCDRGFRRVSWIRLLQKLGLGFVVRLKADEGAHESWWLATSETVPGSRVVKLYDRRMTVEEQFRDTKGKRFGVKLHWTQFRDPEALARFAMLLAVALMIWTVAGRRAADRDPSLRLVSRKKGPRQSFVTIGIRIVTHDPAAVMLTTTLLRKWLEPPGERQLGRTGIGGAK